MFLIIEFTERSEVEVVPTNWMTTSTSCLWPPFRSAARITKMVRSKASPDHTWVAYAARVLHNEDTYNAARRKLPLAEDLSDLKTDADAETQGLPKRRATKPNRLLTDDSDSGGEPSQISSALPEISQPFRTKTSITKLPMPSNNMRPVPSTSASSPMPNRQRSSPHMMPDTFLPDGVRAESTETEEQNMSQPMHSTPHRNPLARLRSAAVTEYDVALLHALERMQQQQEHNGAMLGKICQHLNMTSAPTPLPDGVSFPILTIDALNTVDEVLATDETVRKTVSSIAFMGGSTVDKTVRRLMAYLLSNGVAKHLNWQGKGGKVPFSRLNLRHVVYGGTCSNPSTTRATNSDIEEVIKKWLRFAGDRYGGRRDRDAPCKRKNTQ